MNCDDLKLSLYLDGELPEPEKMADHLRECERCRARIEELRSADGMIAQAAEKMMPPARRKRRWWMIPSGVAAAVLVASLVGLLYVNLQEPNRQEVHVVAGKEWFAGSRAKVRVLVTEHGKGPIGGARVRAELQGVVREAVSNPDGSAEFEFDVPDVEGSVPISFRVESEMAIDRLNTSVQVVRPARLLLTTDKPLYQPGQEIHVRALAMNTITRRPMAGAEAVIEILDPNGTKVFKRTGRASDFGIFAIDFRLADEVILGRWRIRAKVGAIESERTVDVKRYVLPKFEIVATPDREFYVDGDPMSVTIEARYISGPPVVGTVEIDGRSRIMGRLDDQGRWSFQSPAQSRFTVIVKDGADHVERKIVRVPVANVPIQIDIVPVFGEIVDGLENSVYVVTSYPNGKPAVCDVSGVPTDASGVAVLPVRGRMTIVAKDAFGRKASQEFDPQDHRGHRDFAIIVDPLHRAGETMTITALAKTDRTVYVDLVLKDQTILTTSAPTRGGRATIPIDLPQDLSGVMRISAYCLQTDGNLMRDSKLALVNLPEDLVIRPKLSKAEYKPGEEIAIDFEVLDSLGRPVASALTLAVVDEAVFALADEKPGLEREFFRMAQDLMTPRYQFKGPVPDRVQFVANPETPSPSLIDFRYREKERRMDRWKDRYNEFAKIAAGWLVGMTLLITFIYAVRRAVAGKPGLLIFQFVLGVILCFGLRPPGHLTRSQRASSPMAPESETAVGAARKSGKDETPAQPRLREWFPETLYWNSEIITDEHGRARVVFRGADSITTWRMTASGVARDGRLGTATGGIRVFQPFSVDIDLPVALTQNDELWVPVAVYNFTDKADQVTLTFKADPGIELLDPAETKLDVRPNEVTAIHYHVRAKTFGLHRLEVLATAPSFADRVARTIEVSPDGFQVPFAVGDRLRKGSTLSLLIPEDTIDGTHRGWVRLYPSAFSEVVTGLDSLIRMPYG